ncbi:MAG: hypothetical protein LBG26_08590 [Treponema sp.]|nr:hypothetical protein [Treponema sp.]
MIDRKIPLEIIAALETELSGLSYGTAELKIIMHDKKPRFIITRERSIIVEDSGAVWGGEK